MAEHGEETGTKGETLLEKLAESKLAEVLTGGGGSESDDRPRPTAPPEPLPTSSAAAPSQSRSFRLFGRQQPIHQVLGGGKHADLILWRNRNISGAVLVGATAIWILFELVGYHLLTFVCHGLIFSLGGLFLWSNASSFINKTAPRIPEVSIPENVVENIAVSLAFETNRNLATLRQIASGRDIKKFVIVIAVVWLISVIGSWCSFLTLSYIVFVVLYTLPVLYEKYEDHVDSFGERAWNEAKKHYATFDAQVLSKVPRGPLKDKKN